MKKCKLCKTPLLTPAWTYCDTIECDKKRKEAYKQLVKERKQKLKI